MAVVAAEPHLQTFAPKPFFLENAGQWDAGLQYAFEGRELKVGFVPGRVLFHVPRWRTVPDGRFFHEGGHLFVLELGDGAVRPESLEPLPGRSSFFLGPDSARWVRGARHFGRILYREIQPGIDLVFFFDEEGRLVYEFTVGPGANPSLVRLRYEGVERVEAVEPAVLHVVSSPGLLSNGALSCYQERADGRIRVPCAFQKTGPYSFGIEIRGPYDAGLPLVMDPTLVFSSYWGEGGANNRTVVLDATGNIYMSGGTSTTTWPTTPGAYDTTHSGNNWPDATAAKFDPDGNVIWSTFLGGPFEDYAYVSAVNAAGELYLSGRAGDGFPTTAGAFDETFNGGIGGGVHSPTDAFVAKLSAAGDSLLYSTYIGGSGDENGRAIHLLPTGELLVGGGNTTSTNLPVTPGVLKPARGGQKDGWIAKVSDDGSSLGFLTYFGPNNDTGGDETIRGLGVDAAGNIWIGGTTSTGDDLVPTPDAFQASHGGGSEAYIGKISADASSLVYFSWLGGNGTDEIETEGVSDAAGNFFVAGSTRSTNFPVTPGAVQSAPNDSDGFVARINNDGSLGFATYYGGTTVGPEAFFGPVVDGAGNVYCTGRFRSNDLLVTSDAFQAQNAGGNSGTQDAVLAVFSPDGTSLLYGSYFGGTGGDHGRHIGIHPDGSAVVIIGETNSTDIPMVNAPQSNPAGAFMARFSLMPVLSVPDAPTNLQVQ